MRIYYDWEFLENGRTIEPISVGMVAEDGREYYAVNSDAPWERITRNDWLVRNVLPSLPLINRADLDTYLAHPRNLAPRPSIEFVAIDTKDVQVKPLWVIANEIRDFIQATPDVELWGWYAAYDHVCLARLFGPMIDLPAGIPMWTNDLRQEVERLGNPRLPEQPGGLHNALADARHLKTRAEYLANYEAGTV